MKGTGVVMTAGNEGQNGQADNKNPEYDGGTDSGGSSPESESNSPADSGAAESAAANDIQFAEPQLGGEPTLGEATISSDVAERASLNEAAAEAAQVEKEAQTAGTLVGGDTFNAPATPDVAPAAAATPAETSKPAEPASPATPSEHAPGQAPAQPAAPARPATPPAAPVSPDAPASPDDEGDGSSKDPQNSWRTGSGTPAWQIPQASASEDSGAAGQPTERINNTFAPTQRFPAWGQQPGQPAQPQQPGQYGQQGQQPVWQSPAGQQGQPQQPGQPGQQDQQQPPWQRQGWPSQTGQQPNQPAQGYPSQRTSGPAVPAIPGAPTANASGYPGSPGYSGGQPGQGGQGGQGGQPPTNWNNNQFGQQNGPGGQPPANTSNKKLFIILGVVVGTLLILGLGIWLVISLLIGAATSASEGRSTPANAEATVSSSAPSSSTMSPSTSSATPSSSAGSQKGVILPQAGPSEWLEGDCFRDYKDVNSKTDIVECTVPHNAQLVKSQEDTEDANYPGVDAMRVKAQDVCKAVTLNAASNNYTLKMSFAYPTQASWDKNDDRRIDCIVTDADGNVIKDDLVS